MRQTFHETTRPEQGPANLKTVRAVLAQRGLDGFIVPHEDEHQNEYLPEANDRLAWLSGFTGSAGAAIVMADRAAMFTDGRYTQQVRDQVDGASFEFLDLVEGGVPGFVRDLPAGTRLGYDPRLHSPDALGAIAREAKAASVELVACEANPVDEAWGDQRPPQPAAPVVPHEIRFAGESSASKRERLGESLAARGIDAALLTAPASVAWLFNVRGGDVIRTPLPLAQAILNSDGSARLFLDPAKISDALPGWLGNEVSLERPEALEGALGDLKGRRLLIDPAQSSAWYFERAEALGVHIERGPDPCALPRATKNETEIEGARRAHIRDGVALATFLHWVGTEAQETLPDERVVVERLEQLREATGALKDLSFDTIAGAGPNGALPHYRPVERTIRRVEKGSLLLVDGGGQYLDGTTDVTRTMAIGEPSAEQKDRFTRVLKGHIAMSVVRFPAGTTGHQLDVLARLPMWMAGLDYDHGTGHGVGSYLGVHEGPQRIAKAVNTQPLLPGMIVSNEPGYYRPGHWGIRIENLQVVTEARAIEGGERPMLGFETLTFAPIDRRLIEVSLLSDAERAYMDRYHAEVLAKIGPHLDGEVLAWLEVQCAPL
ncbi:MAG: aminopeptidase P family protein [Brevundimonas sp.]|uniref:aminopeptidase P family protein n=1 Tax=Brevundimonas sp. TaxID=1871086 RepID=UPI00391B8FD8